MTVHRVRLADVTGQPWRNGGGTTRELLAWAPRGTAPEGGWAVRVSVADIACDGPFSAFPGVGRAFAVLEGQGVALEFDADLGAGRLPGAHPAGTVRLTPADAAITFDGAQAPGCRLIDGPTRDLNFMSLQAAGRPVMTRAQAGQTGPAGRRWRGLYTHGEAELDTASGRVLLPDASLAWTDDEIDTPWRLVAGGPCWWLALETPSQEAAP